MFSNRRGGSAGDSADNDRVRPSPISPPVDQHLVARVELSANGANVHRSQSLLTAYIMLCGLAMNDPTLWGEVQLAEARLRVFCATGQ